MKQPTSSVILCTRNRIDDLLSCMETISKQIVAPEELIIVDSSDVALKDNEKFVGAFKQELFPKTKLQYVHTEPGLTYQRNVGVKHASSDVVYFFDDDTLLEPDYIQHMNSMFAQYPEYGGGMGTVINIPPKKHSVNRLVRTVFLLQRIYSSGRFTFSGIPTHAYGKEEFKTVEVLGGCCMAYRSWVFKKHLFDEKLSRYAYMEDCDFSCRVSNDSPLFYNPKAKLKHMESPLDRDRVVDNRAMYIKNYSYLFFKNFYPKNKLKIIGYAWSVLGLFFEALLWRKGDYIKGYWKGLKLYYRS